MKKFWVVFALFLVLGAKGLWAGSFEGVVDYQIDVNNKKMNMEYMIKGQKVRTNMSQSGMEMSTIMDLGSKQVTTLMHKQKMYMTHKLDKAMAAASKHSGSVKDKFHKASDTKTILGYTCDHWIYEAKAGKTDMWLASGIGTFMGLSGGKPGSMGDDEWVSLVKSKGMFPLEVDSTGKGGKTMTMVATKVDAQSLSDGLFQVPSDYKKMPDMADYTKGMKSPGGADMLKGMKPKLPF